MNSGFITLIEFLRDFIQQIYLTVVSLGPRIAKPMEYIFVKVSDFISINFTYIFSIEQKYMTIAQLAVIFICTIYMTCIANRESNKKHQGVEAESNSEISKTKKYLTQGSIFLITTIFLPLTNSSIKILAGEIEVETDDEIWLKVLCGVSLFFLLVLIPFIFYKAIFSTRPQKDLFDTAGESFVDVRQIYLKNLERNQNPIKTLFNDYSYEGAYFKMVVMGFKFIQVVLLFNSPNPDKNVVGFWVQYILLIVFFGLNIFYTYKLKPFHSDDENKLAILSQLANMLTAILNIILLAIDSNADNPDSDSQKAVSIAQICICVAFFGILYIKILFSRVPALKKLAKMLLKRLEFTSVKARGFSQSYVNEYENNVIFNREVYDKQKEIEINIWQRFWSKLISQNKKYKSEININLLHFVNPGNSIPYLKNCKGKVEERFEENTRIMQRIGKNRYESEIQVQSTNNFTTVYQNVSQEIELLDSYFDSPNTNSKFCKATIIPFPFTLILSYDFEDKVVEVNKPEQIQLFLDNNRRQDVQESRHFRRILRAMHARPVYYLITIRTTRTKHRNGRDGKRESYSVGATVTYTNGTFFANPDIDTQTTLSNGQKMQVGKGLCCSVFYASGQGRDDEGQSFQGSSYTLGHASLGVQAMKVTGVIGTIINSNTGAWQPNMAYVIQNINLYRADIFKELQIKKQCLSYSFNISILGAKYDTIINKDAVQKLFDVEENKLIKDAFEENKDEFDELYTQLAYVSSSNFKAYKLIFFNDLWINNNELSAIKKNEEILDPSKLKTCLIYQDNTYKEIIEILVKQNLRNIKGKGFFNDKLMKEFQKFILNQQGIPETFIVQSDIISENQKSQKVTPQPIKKGGEKQQLTENVKDAQQSKDIENQK